MTLSADQLLAHHALVVAIPAFVPAIIVVGVVLYIAAKDRREEREELAEQQRSGENPDHPNPDQPDPDHPNPDHPDPDHPDPDHPDPDHPDPEHKEQSE